MLDHMESNGEKSVVCWQPHGRAFTVHKPKEFVTLVMPQFFNQTKVRLFNFLDPADIAVHHVEDLSNFIS
jgi:hypothetical protein